MRSYSYKAPPPRISEVEAYSRTMEAIRTMDRLPGATQQRVRSNWPREFELHAEAIKWAVFAGEAAENKAYKRLVAADFADVHLDFDDDEELPRKVAPLSRAAIADAEIAGAWFAALALLPENIDEFRHAVLAFRRGKRREAWVDDQRIVAMHARGMSLKTIGTNLHGGKLNAEQVEIRAREIAKALARIANAANAGGRREAIRAPRR